MMTPQKPKGEQAGADVGVQVALKMLERALVAHGSGTPKGKAIFKAIHGLTTEFGQEEDKSSELMPAELKTALMAPGGSAGSAPAAGAPPPGAVPPGAAPPGAPAG